MNVWYLIIKSTLSIILFLYFKLRFCSWPTSDNAMVTQPQIFGTAAATKAYSQINEPQHMHGLLVLCWIPKQAKWSFHSLTPFLPRSSEKGPLANAPTIPPMLDMEPNHENCNRILLWLSICPYRVNHIIL